MALNIFFEPESDIVSQAHLAFGGMAPTTVLARNTCNIMVGRYFIKLCNIYFLTISLIKKILM